MLVDVAAESRYPTPFANSTLLPTLLMALSVQKHSPDTTDVFYDEYDYVVVGAGAAGAVVASRLSELSCATVLLLEAGKAPPLLTEVPSIGPNFFDTDVDWQYHTTSQAHTAKAFKGNKVKMPRGKMLGGSTALNNMQYVRGNRKDYDDWAAGGAEGWDYESVLHYFKKMEMNLDPEYLANGYHGRKGPLTVTTPWYEAEIKKPLITAFEELGYEVVDPNGPTQTGIYRVQVAYKEGQRCSTAKAYLVPKENETNLHILTRAMVTKVYIDKNRCATGVYFDFGESNYFVRARKEVILSAGAINTPQLLMLSGIGPAEELNKYGIPVVADLPVGLYLQDHCATIQAFETSQSIPSFLVRLKNESNIEEYIKYKTGPLASTGGRVIENFVNNRLPNPEPDYPPLLIYITESSSEGCRKSYDLKDEVYEQVFAPYKNRSFYLCQTQPNRPESRGWVKLNSSNPYDKPIVNPNYLADPLDVEHAIEGMKICQWIGTSDPMQKVGTKPFSTKYPGCEKYFQVDDLYFRCLASMVCSTLHHPVGTARMGSESDDTTVVTPDLRVKTIDSLRVVDASVMPKIISGNAMIPTIMIAEKASDMIKNDHGGCCCP